MSFPKTEHFSNKGLKPAFSKSLMHSIRNASKEYDELDKKKEDLKSNIKKVGTILSVHPDNSKLDKMFNSFTSSLCAVKPKNKRNSVDKDEIFKDRGRHCEVCRHRSRHLADGHILGKKKFKGINSKYYSFDNHKANILLLCNDCHTDLDNDKLSKTKLKHIVTKVKKNNRNIKRELLKDEKEISKMQDILTKIEEGVKSAVEKSINHSVAKY
ncbi:hypothetical protein HZB03_03400 [Candidatus Woesearchaeota archaeon]|nr:hypothetical protein [Candidatus Woesearchaeota archaeon]